MRDCPVCHQYKRWSNLCTFENETLINKDLWFDAAEHGNCKAHPN